jgi:3-isopropylmalate/(R)-2-methylmalate dehydratase small subunit
MEPFTKFTSKIVPLPTENVDTDQITPARFLKATVKTGFGKNLFYDWRYDSAGHPKKEFILNDPQMAGRKILFAGNNFGCGSSREHAPWALADFGFRAVISTSIADIFRSNCLKNGILPIIVDKASHERLFRILGENPASEFTVDLEAQSLIMPDGGAASFPIDPFSKKCLLQGLDELGYIFNFADRIATFESRIE